MTREKKRNLIRFRCLGKLSASVEKKGMIELVRNIRTMELASGKNMLGHIHKKEIEISKKLRAHIKNFQGLK